MSLNTTFSFDPWEHFRVTRSIGRGTVGWWLLYATTVGLPATVLTLLLVSGTPLGFLTLWMLLFLPVLMLVVLPLVQLRAAFAHRTVHGVPHTFHGMELSERGMRVYCDHTSSEINWPAIFRAEETAEFFLLYHAKSCACYLPKRALAAEQHEKVRVILRQHLGPKAKLTSPAV